jgi:Flp pilus assembly protein CpaB
VDEPDDAVPFRLVADPTSPPATRLRQPKWTDARLVAGVLLVLLAVVLGAAVISAADKSVQVWAVRRPLAAGTSLAKADLVARRVRLFGADRERYVDVRRGDPAGRVLTRDVGEGELLPKAALGDPAAAPATRIVGLPMSRAHALAGDVRKGQRVDVVATRKTSAGGFTTYAVVRRVLVVEVSKPSGGFGAGRNDLVVMIQVEPDQALRVLAAVQSGELDLALVLPGSDGPGDVGDDPVVTGATPRPTP